MTAADSTSHDPGGKVRLPLQPGVRGRALFSDCGRYRHWLSRQWGDEEFSPYALWIGMNPSTAEADVDDPTIRKEMHYTRMMGFTTYVKCNVMDYRATDPKVFIARDRRVMSPRSGDNLETIISMAVGASRIILAYGALDKKLRRYGDDVVKELHGYPLFCMHKTKTGQPGHPLYLPNNAECVPWP